MGSTAVNLSNLVLQNPLIPASGTYGYGMDYLDYYDVNLCGSISIKGTTLHPRSGNAQPRIAETHCGMLNAVGLENPGIDFVVAHKLEELSEVYHSKIIANVCGFSIEEYVEVAKRFDRHPIVGILELNISCPNVHGGGIHFGQDISLACNCLKAVKKATNKPVYVKCTPQCSDLVAMCKALEKAGADGLVLANTYVGMRIDTKKKKSLLANITGGFSGPAIFPLALQKIYQVYPHVNIPIIGCGGVTSAQDVIEMMLAGATAIEIGTANLIQPMTIPNILKELEVYCIENHITLEEMIGRVFHE